MHFPGWVLLLILGPLAASLLLFAGMLFSPRTRGAAVIPASLVLLFLLGLSFAITAKSDLFLPLLLGGPSTVLIATIVALTRALKKPPRTVAQRPEELR